MTRSIYRRHSALGVIGCALLLVTCSSSEVAENTVDRTVPTTQDPSAPPAGRLVPRTCDIPEGAYPPTDCYWLEVPERRDVRDSRTIRLWTIVVHQQGPDATKPPVIDLTGGPGTTASTYWVTGQLVLDGGDSRTIVVVDQRGTGRSEPRLACPDDPSAAPATAAWAARVADSQRRAADCRASLIASGIDLNGYDTVESAADIVDLRRALGVDQFLVRGTSYGGRLAREVLRQDPGGVAGLMLNSPLTRAPQGPASLVRRADAIVAAVTAACDARPTCAANGSIAGLLDGAADSLDAEPFVIPSTGAVIDGGALRGGFFDVMYRTDLQPLVPVALAAIAAGDRDIVETLFDELDSSYDDPRDEFAEALNEVMSCADDGWARDVDDRAVDEDPGVWEDLVLGWNIDCDTWAVDPARARTEPLPPDADQVPVLAVFGGLDPITPPTFADDVLLDHPDATIVVVPAGGHGPAWETDCLRSIVLAFTANPAAAPDTACTAGLSAPFATS